MVIQEGGRIVVEAFESTDRLIVFSEESLQPSEFAIQVNGKNLAIGADDNAKDRWKQAITTLVQDGLIEDLGQWKVFRLTAIGIKVAEDAKAKGATPWIGQ